MMIFVNFGNDLITGGVVYRGEYCCRVRGQRETGRVGTRRWHVRERMEVDHGAADLIIYLYLCVDGQDPDCFRSSPDAD